MFVARSAASRCLNILQLRVFHSSPSDRVLIDTISAKNLQESKGNAVKFLDVRTPERYSEAHITDAVNTHAFFTYLATSDLRGVKELQSTFEQVLRDAGVNGDEGEHVITYEDSLQTLYGASCRALYVLKLLGHPRVSILQGGLEAWKLDGSPTAREVTQVSKGRFQAKWTPSMWSGKEDVLEAIERRDAVLLDVRDLEEWNGVSSSPYGVDFAPRKGRLPGAVHLLWMDLMEQGKDGRIITFKTPEEIREICSAKEITPEMKVIVYCFKGSRAANTYLALKSAGFENVSNYFASWNEWCRDDKLCIDSTRL